MNESIHSIIMAGGLILLGPAMFVYMLSLIFSRVLALRSGPVGRAKWTVAPAYVAVTASLIIFVPFPYSFMAPLAALPGALVIYWFWKREFTKAWLEDGDDAPDGVALENDDWRLGLALLFLSVMAAVVRVAIQRI